MQNITNDYTWSSHRPLLKAIVEDLSPELIVEIGLGNFSTPILHNDKVKKYFGIENDKEWYEYIINNFKFSKHSEVIHHNINLNKAVFPKQLTETQRTDIANYYANFSKVVSVYENYKNKMLFVDNHTCCRTLAINNLASNFDIIVYHDCEPDGIKWYEYYFGEFVKDYNHYYLKTPIAWTGMFIKECINHDLYSVIEKHITTYRLENNITEQDRIYLEKTI